METEQLHRFVSKTIDMLFFNLANINRIVIKIIKICVALRKKKIKISMDMIAKL